MSWLSIELFVRRFGVGAPAAALCRLVQDIRALVLLPHPVHDKHDEEDGAEEADHRAPDHRRQDPRLRKEGHRPLIGQPHVADSRGVPVVWRRVNVPTAARGDRSNSGGGGDCCCHGRSNRWSGGGSRRDSGGGQAA
jgi:hypothetical protein